MSVATYLFYRLVKSRGNFDFVHITKSFTNFITSTNRRVIFRKTKSTFCDVYFFFLAILYNKYFVQYNISSTNLVSAIDISCCHLY
jgi:hypothetical protein